MEQNYSYEPPTPSASSTHSSHYVRSSNGMADPRSLQPHPTTNGAQPYSQSQQALYGQPSYDINLDYRQPTNNYSHEQQLPLPSMSSPVAQGYGAPSTMDTTGQIAPPGMRPRLTTSVFEEEGSICFQVDCNGICVARREDNHMINGTKLLNVAGMTRGRRDGILKAEKQKNVVKIGPMHLKGVWIPFERALALANQEKITEQLYPLFVHNIGALLYHPINAARPGPLPPVQHQEGPLPRLENMGDPLPRPQNMQFVDDPDRLPRL